MMRACRSSKVSRMSRWDYDWLVLGGGAAGLAGAGLGATMGAKTLLVERNRLGGDCTWTGCIPSKTLLEAASLAHRMRHADRYGLAAVEPQIDFAILLAHVQSVRQRVYDHADAPPRLERFGVESRHALAAFVGPREVRLTSASSERMVRARKILVATGARPRVPDIEGATKVPYLTSDSLFESGVLPAHLMVLGSGPIGMEMAQAFRRLGSEVTVISRSKRVLKRDHRAHAEMVQAALEAEGIEFRLGEEPSRFRPTTLYSSCPPGWMRTPSPGAPSPAPLSRSSDPLKSSCANAGSASRFTSCPTSWWTGRGPRRTRAAPFESALRSGGASSAYRSWERARETSSAPGRKRAAPVFAWPLSAMRCTPIRPMAWAIDGPPTSGSCGASRDDSFNSTLGCCDTRAKCLRSSYRYRVSGSGGTAT